MPAAAAALPCRAGQGAAVLVLRTWEAVPYRAYSSRMNFSCFTPGGRAAAKLSSAASTLSPQAWQR